MPTDLQSALVDRFSIPPRPQLHYNASSLFVSTDKNGFIFNKIIIVIMPSNAPDINAICIPNLSDMYPAIILANIIDMDDNKEYKPNPVPLKSFGI